LLLWGVVVDLSNLQINLRPRNNWEAFDLGRTLIKGGAWSIYRPWLYLTIPYALLVFGICYKSPFLGFFIFWFFLPVFERVIIYVLSRSVFGEYPTCKEVLKAFPSELKKGFISLHIGLRLSLARSFMMPVWQLEGLKGKARSKRLKVLSGAGVSQNCGWNGLMYLHVEQLVAAGILTVCYFIIPDEIKGSIPSKITDLDAFIYWLEDIPVWLSMFIYSLTAISMILIRPFYVAGGFTLYICRRMVLEGWDIELQFRSLAERLEDNSVVRKGINLLLLMAFISWPLSSTQANEKVEIREELTTIMEHEEFNQYQKVRAREFKDVNIDWLDWLFDLDSNEDQDESDFNWISLASFFKSLFICLMAGALIWLIWKIIQIVNEERKKGAFYRSKKPELQQFMGMDLSEDSLPEDIAGTAIELIRKGDLRGGISLLYRASLVQFIHSGMKLRDSDTEADCLSRVEKLSQAKRRDFFNDLTLLWVQVAYAHKLPEASKCEQICNRWKELFDHHLENEP